MELYRALLSRSHLSMISGVSDPELDSIALTIRPSFRLDGRADLEAVLGRLLAAAEGVSSIAPKTLDLIGHSTPSTSVLVLGDWVVDGTSPRVTAFFRGLAEYDVLPRLGVRTVRLLACSTAATAPGRSTLCALAGILGVEVLGTNQMLNRTHYDGDGFRDAWAFLLVSSSDVWKAASKPAVPGAARWPRTLDLETLPALPLGSYPSAWWPQRVATEGVVGEILRLIRHTAGAQMPGLIATPSCELALPSPVPGAYRTMHVLFDGAFVRCFPEGVAMPGVLYPVEDAPQLCRIVGELPLLELTR
jgi:hypothetical protein